MCNSTIPARPCEFCHQPFTPRGTQLRAGGGRFCSLGCLGASRRNVGNGSKASRVEMMIVRCSGCGDTYRSRRVTVRTSNEPLCRRCITRKAGRAARRLHPLTGLANPLWKGGRSKDLAEYGRQFRNRHPERARAWDLVRAAVRNGTLVKGPCADCGSCVDVQGHHPDYSKPLDVVWLCRTCHNRRHGKLLSTPAKPHGGGTQMLVLSRQRDESIMIGDDVEVTVVDIRGDKVRLGITAPRQMTVHRKEVYEAIRRENRAAAQVRPGDIVTAGGVTTLTQPAKEAL